MTNGYEVYFWDVGRANKRLVSGFFSPAIWITCSTCARTKRLLGEARSIPGSPTAPIRWRLSAA